MNKFLFLLCIVLFAALLLTGCTNDVIDNDIDIDLSNLSMTMIQSEYVRILSNPADYSGKTIRAYGTYFSLRFGNPPNRFHYIIIVPGDECCQMGFEFKRDGEYVYPDDYPAQNTMIQITGTLYRDEAIGIYIAVDDFLVIGE
jgi:hypothetical protein